MVYRAAGPAVATATVAAAAHRMASPAATRVTCFRGLDDSRIRPPMAAPARKEARATTEAGTENPEDPARANPRKTTLPVMLATKT